MRDTMTMDHQSLKVSHCSSVAKVTSLKHYYISSVQYTCTIEPSSVSTRAIVKWYSKLTGVLSFIL